MKIILQGNKELQVSLFQALVLLSFNSHNTISFEEIKAQTNIEVSIIIIVLLDYRARV